MDIVKKLQARLEEIDGQVTKLRDLVDSEAREFTEEETTQVNALLDERDRLVDNIATHQRVAAAKAADQAGGESAPPKPKVGGAAHHNAGTRITPVVTDFQTRRHGFHSFGDYLHAVMVAGMKGAGIDQRLLANAPTTYATEGAGPDGGYAIPPDYRAEIQELIQSEESLLGRCDLQQSSSNVFVMPTDETADWSSSGVQAYWTGEGSQITESKPVMKQVQIPLHKLAVLVSVTEELASDAPALDRWIRSKAPAKISYEIDRTLIHGTGAGQPLGILNAPCLVTQAAEGSQTADTVNVANLAKMWSRCYAPARRTAVWLMNQDVEPQLLQLTMAAATSYPVYLPPGGFSAAPYATLFGRPVIYTQLCETVGDVGDVILADFQSYIAIQKQMRQDVSMHLYFDYDVLAFRFIMRIGGQPKWSTTLSPRDGSNTYSPFVTLAVRS